MARGDPYFRLRIPEDLLQWTRAQAARNFRSVTSEILIALREKSERMATGESLPAAPAATPNEAALPGASSTHGL